MIITIQPSDIIKRCLWNEYKRYCLPGMKNVEVDAFIVEDNQIGRASCRERV